MQKCFAKSGVNRDIYLSVALCPHRKSQ